MQTTQGVVAGVGGAVPTAQRSRPLTCMGFHLALQGGPGVPPSPFGVCSALDGSTTCELVLAGRYSKAPQTGQPATHRHVLTAGQPGGQDGHVSALTGSRPRPCVPTGRSG